MNKRKKQSIQVEKRKQRSKRAKVHHEFQDIYMFSASWENERELCIETRKGGQSIVRKYYSEVRWDAEKLGDPLKVAARALLLSPKNAICDSYIYIGAGAVVDTSTGRVYQRDYVAMEDGYYAHHDPIPDEQLLPRL